MKPIIHTIITCYAIFLSIAWVALWSGHMTLHKDAPKQYVLSEEPDTFDAYLDKMERKRK